MFIFKLSSWLDKFDPYWYSRFLGLKISYIAIILFFANALLQPPIAPSFIMIIAISGILLIESPTINSFNKKDNVYFIYTFLVLLTIAIFSLNVYLQTWFILVAFAWCYILYNLLKKAPAMFPVVSLILMLGVMSLEGPYTPANTYIVLNQILYFSEFSIIVFWAHKCFPNLYLRVWKSILLRCLENYQFALNSGNEFNHELATKHYMALRNVLPLLTANNEIYALAKYSSRINEFNYFIANFCQDINSESRLRVSLIEDLHELYQGILKNKPVELMMVDLPKNSKLIELVQKWNKICAKN